MAIKKIKLTEDLIRLIQNINFEAFDFETEEPDKKDRHYGWVLTSSLCLVVHLLWRISH